MGNKIKDVRHLTENPNNSQWLVPVKGRTPIDRAKDFEQQYSAHWRRKQVDGYTTVCNRANEAVEDSEEVLREAIKATKQSRRDLKRGTLNPADVVTRIVPESMRGADEFLRDIEIIERDKEAATAMVDLDPADYQETVLERFPSMPLPTLTEEYLLGQADSPFRGSGGGE